MTADLDRERADAPEPSDLDTDPAPPADAGTTELSDVDDAPTARPSTTKTTVDTAPTKPTPTKTASAKAASSKATAAKTASSKAAPKATRPAGSGARAGTGRSTPSQPSRTIDRRVPWVLAILGLIGTVGFAIAWQRADGGSSGGGAPSAVLDGEPAKMADGASAFSTALTNFDGATIDRDFDRIIALSSGEFRGQADEFFSSEVRKQLKEAQASSRGEIRSAYVQSFDGDRGSVFVVLDQTIANNKSPKPKADTLRMELTMVRSQGRWLVSRVAVLTAPSGADTLDAGLGATPTTAAGAGG